MTRTAGHARWRVETTHRGRPPGRPLPFFGPAAILPALSLSCSPLRPGTGLLTVGFLVFRRRKFMAGGILARQVPLAKLAVASQLTLPEEHHVAPGWIVPVDPRGHHRLPQPE